MFGEFLTRFPGYFFREGDKFHFLLVGLRALKTFTYTQEVESQTFKFRS